MSANTANTGHACPIPCALTESHILQALHQAKQDLHHKGRGNAYARLLHDFHRALLPIVMQEAGSLSQAARLLGIHRETVRNYADLVEVRS